jgi:predicted membrane metal-binding protein
MFQRILELLIIIDPLGAVPLFLAIVAGRDAILKRKIACLASAALFFGGTFFMLSGAPLLQTFGITSTSLAAQVFTAPIIFIYFKQISLIAPISNLLVSFTIAPLMIFGFVTSILGRMHPVLGIPTSVVSYGILFYIVKVISLLSSLPGVFIQF